MLRFGINEFKLKNHVELKRKKMGASEEKQSIRSQQQNGEIAKMNERNENEKRRRNLPAKKPTAPKNF